MDCIRNIGLSVATIKNWISILKASFIIFELHPFFENINKRVIKSPKIYFTDTGLVAHLLGIETENQVKRSQLFFYRDTHGIDSN